MAPRQTGAAASVSALHRLPRCLLGGHVPSADRARLVALPALKQMALKSVSGWFFFFFALTNGFSEQCQLTPAADVHDFPLRYTGVQYSELRPHSGPF